MKWKNSKESHIFYIFRYYSDLVKSESLHILSSLHFKKQKYRIGPEVVQIPCHSCTLFYTVPSSV